MQNLMILMAVALFIGMVTASLFKIKTVLLILLLIILPILLYIIKENKKIGLVIIVCILALFGMLEYTMLSSKESKLESYRDEEIELDLVILEEGVKSGGVYTYLARTESVWFQGKGQALKEKLLFKSYDRKNYEVGDKIKAGGLISGFIGKRNFGDSDIGLYYKSKGIYNQFTSKDSKKTAVKDGGTASLFFYRIRDKISKQIDKSLPDREAAFLKGVIIGDRSQLGEDEKENFKKAGLSHLLSISGLHIGFIALMLKYGLSIFRLEASTKDFLSSIILAFYVIMIGAPPPALRSLIMLFILIWGKYLKKDYDMLASGALSAILMLLVNPYLIHNQGFIISYACIFSIAFLYDKVDEFFSKFIKIEFLRKTISLTMCVQIGIAPILIYYFNYLSLINVFINIIAVPMVFLIIAAGFIGITIGIFSPLLGIVFLSMDYYLITFLFWITSVSVALPFSGFYIPSLSLFFYLLYYATLVYLAFKDTGFFFYSERARFALLSILLISALSLLGASVLDKGLRIVFIDVGQGDSSLITTSRGKNILIDGGGSIFKDDYYYDVGGKTTVPSLLRLGVWTIDTIIVSHIHEDHMEGLIKVLESFKVSQVIMPKTPYTSDVNERFLDICKQKGITVNYVLANDTLLIDKNTRIDILFPEERLIEASKSGENNNSLVAKLVYKNFTALFTGDIELEAERLLLCKDISSDIIKIPHHGSKTSSSEEFMKRVSPSISIVSVGKNNFGHPTREALERIEANSSRVLRTDKCGAIALRCKNKNIIIRTVIEICEENM